MRGALDLRWCSAKQIKIKSGPLLPLRGIFPRKRGKQTPGAALKQESDG
jgi:hypothetical protein